MTHFHERHSTKTIPVFLPVDGEVSWSLLPITIIGAKFGYFPEPTKTWLAVKPYALNEGHKYLGGTVGTEKFKARMLGTVLIVYVTLCLRPPTNAQFAACGSTAAILL